MSSFREALSRFREALQDAGEQSESPGLEDVLAYERRRLQVRSRWVAGAAVVLVLAAMGSYANLQQQRQATERARADRLVLERVSAGLARPVPRAMAPLFHWTPRQRGETEGRQ